MADYEDQLEQLASRDLRSGSIESLRTSPRPFSVGAQPSPSKPAVAQAAQLPEKRSNISGRFQAFLSRRATTAGNTTISTVSRGITPPPPITSSQDDFPTLLQKEKQARTAAETALTTVQAELEELSVTLFSEANDMVADERRLRAKDLEKAQALEERAAAWENQAREIYAKWKKAEEESQRQADRVKELEQNIIAPEPRAQEARARDEQRWRRVEALERAVNRLSTAKLLVNGTPEPHAPLGLDV